MKGQAIPNHRRRKGKNVESNTDSATHIQTRNQQRQLHNRDHHILINTNTKCYWSKFPHQKTLISKLDYKGRSNNLLPTGDPPHLQK
jgi:hypothetical protein